MASRFRNRGNTVRVSVCETVDIDTEVDVDVAELIAGLDDEGMHKIVAAINPQLVLACPDGTTRGPEAYAEAAMIAAKSLPECPRPIKDLLWHVHGLAVA